MVINDGDKKIDFEIAKTLEKIEQHLAILRENYHPYNDEWLTVSEAAKLLKISRDTILRLITSAKLKAAKIETKAGEGKRHLYRIHRDWIDEYTSKHLESENSLPEIPKVLPVHRSRCLKPKREFIR